MHQIIDVHHMPGKINVVADGLSHQWEGQLVQKGEGSKWVVNPDRDEETGLVNNMLITLDTGMQEQITALKACLRNEHLFIEVIKAILG